MAHLRFIKVTLLDKDKNIAPGMLNIDNILAIVQEADFTRIILKDDCEVSIKEEVNHIFEVLNNSIGL